MTPEQITAYIQAGTLLVSFGKATVDSVRARFAKAQMSEAELNAICAAVADDAHRRKAIADADAGGTPNG
jgi:hypothetical protein